MENVVKHFPVRGGAVVQREVAQVRAVEDVSFTLATGETLGLVGESGCGKSTLARLVTALHPVTSGHIRFKGAGHHHPQPAPDAPAPPVAPDGLPGSLRITQPTPEGRLHPRRSLLRARHAFSGTRCKKEVQDLMARVGLSPEHYNRFPSEFSGGQRQRIGIARALALRPDLIVCDEPVSALDVSIQAQIINLLEDLQDEFNLTYIFIAHDLSVVRHVSDRMAVMYLGKLVETGPVEEIYSRSRHPYTASLLSAVPVAATAFRGARKERVILSGDVPSPGQPTFGMPVPSALPQGPGALCHRRAVARAEAR